MNGAEGYVIHTLPVLSILLFEFQPHRKLVSVHYKVHMLKAVLQNNNCSLYPIISVLVDRTELKPV
jgi:hypothetical protein